MMKKNTTTKIIAIIIIIQFFPFQMFAQFFDFPTKVLDSANLIVTYRKIWKQDTNNLEQVRKEDMILFAGKKISMFVSKNFYQLNLQGRKAEREGRLNEFLGRDLSKFRTRWNYKIYKNYPIGRITYAAAVLPTLLQYDEAFDVFSWQLTEIVDTIGGYVVHCAYTDYGGRHWIAWYTTDIPINDGPYKFRGLPGLIIKLYDDKKHYIFEMVSIERPIEKPLIEFEERDWVQTSRSDFLKAQENFRLDIISRAKEAGVNSEGQQKAARAMARRNNPIEF